LAELNFCICGGGSLSHATAGVLAANPANCVNVLTRKPELWRSEITVEYLENYALVGVLNRVSADPADVIPEADVVILCVPTYARPEVLTRLRPFLSREAWLGSFPGFGGFGWVAREIVGPQQNLFGFQRIPFVSSKIAYGERVKMTGIRPQHFVATLPPAKVNAIAALLREALNIWIVPMPNYLSVCLSMSNSLFHPARIYSLFRQWTPGSDVTYERPPYFYADWDDEATKVFFALDAEVQECCRRIPLDLAYVKPILQHYEVAFPGDLTAKIRTIRALSDRKIPMLKTGGSRYIPDITSFYFVEDIPYGLVVVKAIAFLAGVETPMMDAIIHWYENISGQDYLNDGLLNGKNVSALPLPQNYGITDLDALIKFCSA
jgi:hypothetical protein